MDVGDGVKAMRVVPLAPPKAIRGAHCACLGAGMTAPCIGGSRDVEEAKRLVESAVGDGS
jgi:hypothetical protein